MSKRSSRLSVAAALVVTLTLGAGWAACGWWTLETRTPPVEDQQAAPDFALPDHQGKEIRLSDLLAQGPVVVVFYRGFW